MSTMIDYADKAAPTKPLYDMFTAVPRRYDLVNRVITWGLDRRWRRKATRECLASKPERLLDLCCGTGDLAIELAQLAENPVEITGIDYSQPMLEIAAKKARALAPERKVSFIHGDVANLPFTDGYLDCIGVSFAFRNLTYKNPWLCCYLAEVLRVLRAGGRLVIVETSQPDSKFIRQWYHRYLRWFVYRVGHLLSGNRVAYHYLAESAARFYTAEETKKILLAAEFSQVTFRHLLLGAVAIHTAIK